MSAEFERIRRGAVRIAGDEMRRDISELIETGRENYGGRITVYLQTAGVSQQTIDDPTARGAANRMWCGMFVYYCYKTAAGAQNLPFDPSVLWGGRGLFNWAQRHPTTIVPLNSPIEAGDIFVTHSFHIAMATGAENSARLFPTIEGNQGDTAHTTYKGIQRLQRYAKGCRVIIRI